MRGQRLILALLACASWIALCDAGQAAVKSAPKPRPSATNGSAQTQSDCTLTKEDRSKGQKGSKAEPSKPGCPDPDSIGAAEASLSPPPASEIVAYNDANDLASPLFQTLEGQLYSETRGLWLWSSQDDFNAKGVKKDWQRSADFSINQTLRYGITDDLSVAVHFSDHVNSVVKIHPVSGPSTSMRESGWEDPEFDAIYRVLAQPEAPFYLDVIPQYSPDIVSHSQMAGLAERAGFATEKWIFEMHVAAYYHWSGDSGQGGRSSLDKKVGAEAFYQFDDRWSANANAAYHFSAESPGDWTFSVHGQLNYYLVPDKLQASVEYEHDFISDKQQARNSAGNFIGIRLGYLFDLYVPKRP